jgi:hypothetical protein
MFAMALEPLPLRRDQRGSILIIGLFAALSLCGALWMLIGLGDAIVFHDRGQEAADAAALSAAAVHARAMNATAAMNFVMLVMAGSYLSFSVIADLALVSAAYVVSVPFGAKNAAEMGAKAHEVFGSLVRFEQSTGSTLAALDLAQSGLAVGGPALGTVAGLEVAGPRKNTGMSLGWSNFPATAIARTGERAPYAARPSVPNPPLTTPEKCTKGGIVCSMANKFFPVLKAPPAWNPGPNNGRSLGLPVAAEPASTLCIRAGGLFFKDFGDAVDPFELGDGADETMKTMKAREKKLPIPVHCSDQVNRTVVGPMAGVPRSRDVWTAAGPKRMTAANGDMAMRVLGWATTKEESVVDDAVRRVKLAAYDLSGSTDRSVLVYDAQAEFYYGCSAKWNDASCNGEELGTSGVGYEQALYGMNWRARLTRSNRVGEVFGGARSAVADLGGRVVNRAGVSIDAWMRVSDHFRAQDTSSVPSLH